MDFHFKHALKQRCGGGSNPETGLNETYGGGNNPETGTTKLAQTLRSSDAVPTLHQGTASGVAMAPFVKGPARHDEHWSASWWSQSWDNTKWGEEKWQHSAPAAVRATSTSSTGSDASTKTKAMEKRARRNQDVDVKKADQTQNLNRLYAKFLRIAASSIFRTTNEYYDKYEGFWHVPKLGDPAPTVDTLFWLYTDEELQSWGNDTKFAPSRDGAVAELQLQTIVDTSMSLQKLAGATLPATRATATAVPLPDELDHRTARGQPNKDGSPYQGRAMDLQWMNGDDVPKTWKSAPRYDWQCSVCERRFTPEEYLAAHRVCTNLDCQKSPLVSSDDGPWADINSTIRLTAANQRPSAPRAFRSSSLPSGTTSNWALGYGRKAVLKSSRSASMPPVAEEQDPADYQWSQGQRERVMEGGGTAELRDSSWDHYVYNTKMNIGLSLEKPKVTMLETAAYTMSRLQVESRGWIGNLTVGHVTEGEALTPQQFEQSKTAKFRPLLTVNVEGPSTVNPSYEVHQVKWSRKALGQLSQHVQRARRWLVDNPTWHPNFEHATPKQEVDGIGGGNTPKAKAYAWPDPKESQAQRKLDQPPSGRAVPKTAPPPTGKITVTNADGTPYEFPASSDDETDPATGKAVAMPRKLMSPYMEVGSLAPVTWKQSREVRKAAARTSYKIALETYRAATQARMKRREASNDARRPPAQQKGITHAVAGADPLGLAATPVEKDPLNLETWGSQSLGTTGMQIHLRPRRKRTISIQCKRRGASGTRPVPERRREIMRNVACGLPATSLIPATKLTAASGEGKTPEAAGPDAETSDAPSQHVPAPTEFSARFLEVDKAADKPDVDLAAKVRGMTLEDNPGLAVPVINLAQPLPGLTSGTTVVSLDSSSSSESSSEVDSPSVDPTATSAADALETARAAASAATELMQVID